ncbi:hypothetical protein [Acaryochloris sp. 'Moss Beach']|uniref:hypothetical protein n=1 Tax=Acaryochloris sp. 'Moss Beach' TaxID=2740837 RepID=UPI001F27EFCF|nr:hypothetical protein [Acaryochloris sp. 'Moss Beach']
MPKHFFQYQQHQLKLQNYSGLRWQINLGGHHLSRKSGERSGVDGLEQEHWILSD